MIVNRGQMAAILGVSEPTLDRMVQRREVIGKKKGAVWEFDTKAVITKLQKDAARNTTGSKKGLSELRISLADAELKEFKVAEMRKTMVHIDDILPLFEEQLSVIKSKITALPARLAQALAVEEDPAVILRLLKGEVAEVLEGMSTENAKGSYNPATAKPPTPDDEIDEDEEDEDEEDPAPPSSLTDDGY